ncbi:protein localization to microtubule organizing center [Mactra antiquata]
MFAKPAPKKPANQGVKQKPVGKPKTVSVKTGIKVPAGKKLKQDVKKSLKPPPRQDAGYSLYSSDGEDQVMSAYNEMEACEKILTQIKHKQKEGEVKTKGKKKKKDKSPLPKPLNDNPVRADIVPGFSSIYGTTYPYGTALFLRQLQSQDLASNPMFNSRLASSTPDPEKHLSAAGKLPVGNDQVTHEIPERDVSTVSSVGPSTHHVQNMADMIDIYKRLEYNKATQLQEAMVRAEIEKFKEFQSASVKPNMNSEGDGGQGHGFNMGQGHEINRGQGQDTYKGHEFVGTQMDNAQSSVISDQMVGRPSDGFIGTGSLGFHVPQGQYVFQPVTPGNSVPSGQVMMDSSLTAFKPYLSHDSKEILPPHSWMSVEGQGQPNFQIDLQENSQGHVNIDEPQKSQASINKLQENDIPSSGRTDMSGASKGTDYVMLPRRSDGNIQEGQEIPPNVKVSYEKQNGLFQIHQKKSSSHNSSASESRSDKSGSGVKGQGSLDEVPERDLPVPASQSAPTSIETHSSKEGTYSLGDRKNESQNLSDVTTPRNVNNSGTGSTSSYGGRIVFIPNDSSTQNVIGYVPGIPIIPGTNQPITITGTNDAQGQGSGLPSNSVLSSGTGQQGQTSQLTSQGHPEGSSYQSILAAKTIAAGDIGVRKLRYLLKELKECTNVSKDVEICRLVKEIDEAINTIPQLALTFNLQTEIDLAIQPLRSENSQLRRKLRLLNQQVKEKDLAANDEPKDINFEIMHLQTSNDTLQKVLKEEREIKTRLAAEVQYLYNEIHKMKVERSRLIADTSEKETNQLKIRQEMTLESQKLQHDLDLVKKEVNVTLTQLESIEKENHILQITLKERDIEIERQSEIVELMKESIGELLDELEQSRIGEKTWDHNTSYGLSRLMKIVEDGRTGLPREQTQRKQARTPERKAFDFNQSDSSTSTARLTRAALAYHDRKHGPVGNRRQGPDGRQGPASESELDTLVELRGRTKQKLGQGASSKPGRRRHSSSSPVRLRNESLEQNFRHHRTSSSPKSKVQNMGGNFLSDWKNRLSRPRETTIGQDSDDEHDLSPTRRQILSPSKRVPIDRENVSPKRRVHGSNIRNRCMETDPSEVSVEQSRYSVTDYFQKYHPQDLPVRNVDVLPERSRPPIGRLNHNIPSRHLSHFKTSSEIDDRTVKSSEVTGVNRNSRRGKFFVGLSDDQTISAINDDDNVSSVSMSSVTTANTVDDSKFRQGIATLDANIAKLQQALQKTKSMLT